MNRKSADLLSDASNKLPQVMKHIESISDPINSSSSDISELALMLKKFQQELGATQVSLKGFTATTTSVSQNLNNTSESIDQASLQLSQDIGLIYASLTKQLKELRGTDD